MSGRAPDIPFERLFENESEEWVAAMAELSRTKRRIEELVQENERLTKEIVAWGAWMEVARAIAADLLVWEKQGPVTPEEIDEMVDRYRSRLS